jgi:hypothetical protein
MLGVAHNQGQRCAATTAVAFIYGLRSRIQALPYFVHMVAT